MHIAPTPLCAVPILPQYIMQHKCTVLTVNVAVRLQHKKFSSVQFSSQKHISHTRTHTLGSCLTFSHAHAAAKLCL